MKFLTRTACTTCGGTGRNPNPAWQAFKDWQRAAGVRTMEAEHHKRSELGLSFDGPHKPGDRCSHCAGTGEIECWRELSEILPQLSH